MWAVFTYIWNFLLIIFISLHLLVGALITFLIGVYSGIYLCQNYEIPKIDPSEPTKLWAYFINFLEQHKKPGGTSILQLTRSNSMLKASQPSSNVPKEDVSLLSSTLSSITTFLDKDK